MNKIALCQTVKGRLPQAQLTVPYNLSVIDWWCNGDMWPEPAEVILVIVDFDCPHQTSWYMLEHYGASPYLYVMEIRTGDPWEFSSHKNCAHRLGIHLGADYVVNLDIDNYITETELSLMSLGAQKGCPTHFWSGKWSDGTYGKIGVPSDLFLGIGQYHEGMVGGEDPNLLWRLEQFGPGKFGMPGIIRCPSFKGAIENDTELSKAFLPEEKHATWEAHRVGFQKPFPKEDIREWTGQLFHQGEEETVIL